MNVFGTPNISEHQVGLLQFLEEKTDVHEVSFSHIDVSKVIVNPAKAEVRINPIRSRLANNHFMFLVLI
jgi:hypothetical protein|tara:strand:+ start:967 stop:1173 length:207 start_codon:yes stop_codon:yes gene_type:complete